MTFKRLGMPLVMLFAVMALAAHPGDQTGTGKAPGGQSGTETAPLDFKKLLPGPPPNNSKAAHFDLSDLMALQGERTPAQVAKIRDEDLLRPGLLTQLAGPKFDAKKHPTTDALLSQVQARAE